MREIEREREKNRIIQCSPETKTETEPNRSVFNFLTTDGVGSVRFFGIRFGFGEPYGQRSSFHDVSVA